MMHDIISSFNGGEFSPYIASRTSLDKYRNGCKKLENFLITPYGPINRRPGTQFMGSAKLSSTRCRLFGLNLSDSNKIVMELGVGYVRFWQNAALQTYPQNLVFNAVLNTSGATATLTGSFPYVPSTITVSANLPTGSVSQGCMGTFSTGVIVIPGVWPGNLSLPRPQTTSGGSTQSPATTINYKVSGFIGGGYPSATNLPVQVTFSSPSFNGINYSPGSIIEAIGIDDSGNYLAAGITSHPYQEGDLRGVNVCQINDVVYLTHPNYPPMRLSYWANSPDYWNGYLNAPPWTIGPVAWKWAPMLDQNYTSTTITPSSISGTPLTGVAFAYSTTTITATKANHGLTVGTSITVTGAAAAYNGTWTINQIPDQNTFVFVVTTAPTAASSGAVAYQIPAPAGSSITLSASSPIWSTGHVGAFWQLDQPNPNGTSNLSLSSNGQSGNIQVQGSWALQTFGIWFGTIYVDQSVDGGQTWSAIRNYYSNGDYNTTDNGTATGVGNGYQILPYFRIRFVMGSGTPSQSPRCLFQVINPTLSGLVKITGFTDSQNVTASVIAPIIGTGATSLWTEGAFSDVQGYPNTVVLHESRIVFGGSFLYPNRVWGSYVGDFQNFKQGANASDSYAFSLASQSQGRIQWMISKMALLIGTTTDEWYISSTSQGAPITPGSVYAQKQSHYGSAPFPAFIVNDTTLYVQRMGRKIREFLYTWQSQTWVSNDLTALSSHISLQGIQELAYQRVPDAILWFIRGDGTLCAMTYEREQQVSGFSRMLTNPDNGDFFESVCTINSSSGEDEVWFVVNRTINGSSVRYIERFAPGQRDALDSINYASYWYLDAAKSYSFGSPTTTITGLDHLNGQSVAIWGDGAVVSVSVATATVSGGSITLGTPVSNCVVGLPYVSTVVPETLYRDLQDGTSSGRRMRIATLNVRLYNSFGGESSQDGATWFPMKVRSVGDAMDASPVAYDGYRRVSLAGNWRDGADLYLRSSLPCPFTVAAVVGAWESTEQGQ
jgi:hypothetical protein